MANGQNVMDSSMAPQGLMSPVMPSPYDVQRNGPVPMSTLASTLASATPENQRMVRSFLLSSNLVICREGKYEKIANQRCNIDFPRQKK